MKSFTHILLVALALVPCGASVAAPLSGTAGSNLTAYNPGGGVLSNNEWNAAMNGRSGATAPAKADFGNCNSVILRCASPKCGNGGCASIDVAMPIVAGCVASNATCRQYGDELTNYIAAQLVASSTAKTNAQMAAAQTAAAEQSVMQMQQMQMQMQQMQQQMAEQNAAQIEQLQSALEQQQRAAEEALAQATAAQTDATTVDSAAGGASGATPTTVIEGLSEAQRIAANAGVSADILAREQVAGQIMTSLERAQVNLSKARAAMQNAFSYAGCTTSGDNCVGPKRVSVFRQKAMEFFDPYDAVLDELYDALITAQSVGVDITDIYMMLNGSCNVWGEYLCYGGTITQARRVNNNGKIGVGAVTSWATYTDKDITDRLGNKILANCEGGKSKPTAYTKGGIPCQLGAVIPPEDSPACTLNRTLTDMDTVQRNFLFAEGGDIDEHVRVGCASSALENSKFFRNRKKGSSIDIETLQRIVAQDAPATFGSNKYSSGSNDEVDRYKYCALTSRGYSELERAVATKKLPSRVCVKDSMLRSINQSDGRITEATFDLLGLSASGASNPDYKTDTVCNDMGCTWDENNKKCNLPSGKEWQNGACVKKTNKPNQNQQNGNG